MSRSQKDRSRAASGVSHDGKKVIALLGKHEFSHNLLSALEDAGYRVTCVRSAAAALKRVRRKAADLALVELTCVVNQMDRSRVPRSGPNNGEQAVPMSNNLDALRRMRQYSDVPVLVLAADLHAAEGFVDQESCADDFALLSSSLGQVLARIQALLRWAENRKVERHTFFRAGDLEVQPAYHQATIAGQPVDMTRTELTLLIALATEPGRAFSRSELVRALHDGRRISERTISDRTVSERTIDSHIKNLRSKVEVDPSRPRRVLTVFGIGYKLNDRVIL